MTNAIALLRFIVDRSKNGIQEALTDGHTKATVALITKTKKRSLLLLLLRRHCLFIMTLHHTVVTSVDTVAKGPPASSQETIERDDTKWVIKIANKGRRVSPIRWTKIKRNFPAAKRASGRPLFCISFSFHFPLISSKRC